MGNTQTPVQTPQKRSALKPILFSLLVVILILAAAGGVYYWQNNQMRNLNAQVSDLQAQVTSLKAQQPQTDKTDTFTYSSKVGGLTLTLPKTYGVIVNADGNKGGAIGATLRIASVRTGNIFTDQTYPAQGVQIDIDNTYTGSTLEKEVSFTETKLKDQGYSSFKVADATVAGLPAKLITVTDQVPYRPQLYIVGSDDFLYTITSSATPPDSLKSMVTTVLKGLQIKPVTLQTKN
jgi:hypothetical protein